MADVKALIIADGDVRPPAAGQQVAADAWERADLVVAADGGARKAERLGIVPHLVVGDMDSLSAEKLDELAGRGVELQRHPIAKDASDSELAVLEAVRRGATEVVVLGALGGPRFEHTLANVLLLTLPDLVGRDVRLVDGRTTVRVVGVGGPATLELAGDAGDLLSLLPLTDAVEGVTTAGLAYPLSAETLHQGSARGLSNVLLRPSASVTVGRGRLAVIHTAAAPADGADG